VRVLQLNENQRGMSVMKYLSVLLWVSLAAFYTGMAQATEAPYYAYGSIYTSSGYPDYTPIEANDQASAGAVSVAGGSQWWCDAANPNCGVSVSSGASVAYAEVNVDPVTGALGARAGSLGYNAYGGYGSAYGYISQVFRVGTDGSLQAGDNVTVDLNMLLEGSIDAKTMGASTLAGLVTLDYYDPAQYDAEGGYMPYVDFTDNLYTQPYLDSLLANVKSVNYQTPGVLNTVDFQGSATADVHVGDILTLQGMILTTNSLGYSDGLNYSWTDALNTMTPSLTTQTSGAILSAYQPAVVPVPAAVWLFGSGLLGLIGIARRKA
jgi:hypothetical protein